MDVKHVLKALRAHWPDVPRGTAAAVVGKGREIIHKASRWADSDFSALRNLSFGDGTSYSKCGAVYSFSRIYINSSGRRAGYFVCINDSVGLLLLNRELALFIRPSFKRSIVICGKEFNLVECPSSKPLAVLGRNGEFVSIKSRKLLLRAGQPIGKMSYGFWPWESSSFQIGGIEATCDFKGFDAIADKLSCEDANAFLAALVWDGRYFSSE